MEFMGGVIPIGAEEIFKLTRWGSTVITPVDQVDHKQKDIVINVSTIDSEDLVDMIKRVIG